MKKTKKIIVTGGAGFIGSNFIRYMIMNGKSTIINLDKLTYSGNLANLKDIANNQRYRFVKGDILDASLVNKLTKEADVVINFAAESHVDRSIRDPQICVKTNVLGTQNLLDHSRKNKIKRFIQISTDEVYGSIAKGFSNEKAPLMPNSPYAASKTAADLLVRSYYVTYKMPVIITRSSNNFGPFQYPEKVIPLFITNLLENKKVPVYADGSNIRDWIYVEDNCDAIKFILENGVCGEVYNIGGNNEIKNIKLTRMIISKLGKTAKCIKFVKDRPGHDKRYALNSAKIYRLGWRPTKGLFEEKLQHTIDWYAGNVKWWKKLKKKKEKFW